MFQLSHVAGIIDRHGGLRVVVTRDPKDFARHHKKRGERVFIVPDFLIQEPVPWQQIPWMWRKVEAYIDDWIRKQNDPDLFERGCVGEYRARRVENQATLAQGRTYGSRHYEEDMVK